MADLSFVIKTKTAIDGNTQIRYNDLEIAGGDLVLTTDYDRPNVETARQSILATLSVFRGEWFLDNPDNPAYGIEYIGEILGTKGLPIDFLNSILTDAILSDNTVASIQELSSSLDRATRVATVNFACTLKTGETMREALELQI